MSQETFYSKKKFNPYDLSAIPKFRKNNNFVRSNTAPTKQSYKPEHFHSAYDLSKRPGG